APVSRLAVAPYLGRAAATVAPILEELTAEGLSADHLAFFLDLLASEREAQQHTGDDLELVCTGPETSAFPTRDTRIVVRELFRKADESVLVAGYAVYQGHDVFRALAERMDIDRDLRVQMFLDVQRTYGDKSRPTEILRRFADRLRTHEWPGSRLPDVY